MIPVVGECDDGDLADSRTVVVGGRGRARWPTSEPRWPRATSAPGTGMICFDFPGGIGTASRVVGEHRVGVLLLCNFGDREYLDVPGTEPGPVQAAPARAHGSCIAVCATDAPLSAQQLRRLALRPLLGLARVGSYGGEGSGEIGLAFTTATDQDLPNEQPQPDLRGGLRGRPRGGLNCLVAAPPGARLDGSMQEAFPLSGPRAPDPS